ncbi:hypothetical protein PSUB009319_42850 [Ralstonia sp. SET104]|nr:hypothetical protein PSUB009319_42850 [Ralstonia sp. SET104]
MPPNWRATGAFAACRRRHRSERHDLISQEKPLSRAAIHLIVKEIFKLAADRLRAQGPEFGAQAGLQASASAHWLRHTAGSHMTDQ